MLKLIFTFAAAYLLLGLYFYWQQRNMIYFPRAEVSHPFREFAVENQGESIYVIAVNEGKDEAVIYFGGNAEAAGYSAQIYAEHLPEQTLYFVNYRGYGKSSGEPTQKGLYSDALRVYDTVSKQHRAVSTAGRSLGSSIAVYLAANRKIKNLALITPFDSIEHIAQDQLPIYPVSLFLKDKYDSLSYVPSVSVKHILIMTAEKDRIIGQKYTQNLTAAFKDKKPEIEEIQGRGHNSISDDSKYYEVLRTFFGKMAP